MALDSAQSHASKAIEEKLGMIESLFMKFTPDYLSNLKMILETACDLTSAETGYILRYNDKTNWMPLLLMIATLKPIITVT